ncbi:hypothetical protein Tco_1379567 [Tanacetum coccineum]
MSSDSHATVTYTSILSDYQEPSDAGSPRVIIYEYDGLPIDLLDPFVEAAMQALTISSTTCRFLKQHPASPFLPPSPDYVPGLEHPASPFYVPEPKYPEYLVPDDDEVHLEDQPLPTDASHTALSLGYIVDSDPEEDPKDESEDGPTDYPADGGDDDDDDDSSEDDANDEEDEVEESSDSDEEEEDEHIALTVPAPAIHDVTPISFPPEAKVARLLAIPTPPPSPVSPLPYPLPPFFIPSPPTTSPTYKAPLGCRAVEMHMRASSPPTPLSSPLPQIPSPPLPLSSPLPLPPPIILPRTRASMVLMRAAAQSTYRLAPPSGTPPLLSIPLPTPSALLLLPFTDRRADILEAFFRLERDYALLPDLDLRRRISIFIEGELAIILEGELALAVEGELARRISKVN